MATPSTNEVLFVVIIVVLFFILLGVCVYCVHKATAPTKRQREAMEQQQASMQAQQIQYITASQLESLRPPELARQLYGEKQDIMNDNKRHSILNKFFSPHQQRQQVRPSSMREPSFLPMQQPPSIVIDDAVAIRDAEIAALAQSHPPPAYGDNRTSIPLRYDQQPTFSEKR
ncbi:hypothetical protein BDA99DRAFT_495432 [Phascolomyces articulosus]|uniref:Uncharacterized protein n=1 Tax=Phascolomyces articulosus TaxID=60185 RepID=A0AAD5KQJ0_9FUNG|nr:hypothetical protein BDA99DRAFT_495432 [Phascolomyces articulosus]